mmetsp:Transcript_14184/g.16153  ORF Transcript_14184/g.16153 Transcript_14184/m.16153 type:complete len:238 (-) Transcript_14184:855-1568(-)
MIPPIAFANSCLSITPSEFSSYELNTALHFTGLGSMRSCASAGEFKGLSSSKALGFGIFTPGFDIVTMFSAKWVFPSVKFEPKPVKLGTSESQATENEVAVDSVGFSCITSLGRFKRSTFTFVLFRYFFWGRNISLSTVSSKISASSTVKSSLSFDTPYPVETDSFLNSEISFTFSSEILLLNLRRDRLPSELAPFSESEEFLLSPLDSASTAKYLLALLCIDESFIEPISSALKLK